MDHGDALNMEEKGYSDDEHEAAMTKNNFMLQVHQQRRNSMSYSKQPDPPQFQLMADPMMRERRHSADKILCKPSSKKLNSAEYLNRMVITLRSKMATYKEELRAAAKIGQQLFSENAKKEIVMKEQQEKIKKLRLENEEISNRNERLVQSTQLDAEHTERLKRYTQHILRLEKDRIFALNLQQTGTSIVSGARTLSRHRSTRKRLIN